MFNPSSSPAPTYSDLSMQNAVNFSSDTHTAPTQIPRGNGNGGLLSPFGVAASVPPPYNSLLHSYHMMNRSTSSHSFPHHVQFSDPLALKSNVAFSCPSPSAFQFPFPPVSSSPASSCGDLLEFSSSGTMRRVVSTGNLLQGKHVPLPPPMPPRFSGDGCSQEGGEPFPEKVGRYSAEERKERIERYRSKRQQRNFQKKITYACRKTLADSRPRVQGRFARNAETEGDAATDMEIEASDISYEHSSCNDLSGGGNCYDGQSQCGETGGDSMVFDDNKWWWWATPLTANRQQQQQLGFDVVDDEEQLWASLADMCSGT